jgi:hypothetical protein
MPVSIMCPLYQAGMRVAHLPPPLGPAVGLLKIRRVAVIGTIVEHDHEEWEAAVSGLSGTEHDPDVALTLDTLPDLDENTWIH